MSKNDKENKLLYFAIIIAIISFISIIFPYDILDGSKWRNFVIKTKPYNELGDFISGITVPWVSLAGFILLYLTYKSQRNQYVDSMKLVDKQMFETTFFNALTLIDQVKNNLYLILRSSDGEKTEYYGNDVLINLKNIVQEDQNSSTFEKVNIQDFFERHEQYFEQYYDYILQIMSSIATLKLKRIPVDSYIKIFQAQLSVNELCIVHYFFRKNNEQLFIDVSPEFNFFKRNNKEINYLKLLSN